MKNEEVQKLVQLRTHVIKFYNDLVEAHSPTAVMNTRDTAILCEEIISSLDDVVRDYVNFQKES